MRFRFEARLASGEPRGGFVEAASEEDARRQLSRRGLTILSVSLSGESSPPTEASAAPTDVPKRAASRPSRANQVDWPARLVPTIILTLLLGLVGWLGWRWLGPHTFPVRVTGTFHLKSRHQLDDSYWKRFQADLIFDELRLRVDRQGRVYRQGKGGEKADAETLPTPFSMDVEGNYTFEIQIKARKTPKAARVMLLAPGFLPADLSVVLTPTGQPATFAGKAPEVVLRRPKRGGGSPRNPASTPAPTAAPTSPTQADPEAAEAAE